MVETPHITREPICESCFFANLVIINWVRWYGIYQNIKGILLRSKELYTTYNIYMKNKDFLELKEMKCGGFVFIVK